MLKEIIISVIIVFFIISLDIVTQNYTKETVVNTSEKLSNLKEKMKNTEENISNDIENTFSDSTFIQNPLHLSTSSGTLFPVHYLL